MQVNRVQNNPSFGIKVSPHFSKTVQNFYNYGNVPNKRNLIWTFNQKADEYFRYGYNEFTLDYERKQIKGNWQHFLVAVSDSNPNKKIVIAQRDNLAKIIRRFLELNQGAFRGIMKSKQS